MATQKITTFLMFQGQAEAAMDFYASLFPESFIKHIRRYGPGEMGTEGSVMQARFSLAGQEFMAIDSNMPHPFTFTPSMSLFVNCASEAEIDRLFEKLSEGGQVLMGLQEYPFARRFAWCNDRFGVSWQLALAMN